MSRPIGHHHGDLRAALLQATLDLLAEGADPSALSMRAVARRAGVSPAAPYHHFADKPALLAGVAEAGFAALIEVQARHAHKAPRARLAELCADHVRFGLASPHRYALMFRRPPHEVEGGEALEALALAGFGALVEAVAALAPKRGAADHARLARLIWAMAHGAVQVGLWSPGGLPADGERLALDVGEAALALVG